MCALVRCIGEKLLFDTTQFILLVPQAAAKAEAEEAATAQQMKKLTSRERKKKRKEAARQKKKNAQTLEQLLAAQEALASGLTSGSVPMIPLTPFELWELPWHMITLHMVLCLQNS